MECSVHFYQLNDLFSEEFAEEQHGGEESADNRRYLWEDEFALTTPVSGVEVHSYETYPLIGSMPDGKPFTEMVGNMRMFEFKSEAGQSTWMGCSERIIDSYEISEEDGELELAVYLKDNEPMANPIPGIYIASGEFPESLIL